MRNLLFSLLIPIFCFSLSAMEQRDASACDSRDVAGIDFIKNGLRGNPKPIVIARDADVAIYDAWESSQGSSRSYLAVGPSDFRKEPTEVTIAQPVVSNPENVWISPDGKWLALFGYDWGLKLDGLYILHHSEWTQGRKKPWCISELDNPQLRRFSLTFLTNTKVICKDTKSLYEADISDLAQRGKSALKLLFTRDDGQEYSTVIQGRSLSILDDGRIVCIGPNKKSIEIMSRSQGHTQRDAVIKTEDPIEQCMVSNSRAVAATREYDFWTEVDYKPGSKGNIVSFYDLSKKYPCKTSSIVVAALWHMIFLPNGKYLACGTWKERNGVIDMIDCSTLEKPFLAMTITVWNPSRCLNGVQLRTMMWTPRGLNVSRYESGYWNYNCNNYTVVLPAAFTEKESNDGKQENDNA